MMDSCIKLKGNKYGLALVISQSATMDEIKEEAEKLFKNPATRRMFGKESIAIGFEGKLLNEREKEEILSVITANSELNIVCVMDFNVGTEEKFRRAVERFEDIPEVKPLYQSVETAPQATPVPTPAPAPTSVVNPEPVKKPRLRKTVETEQISLNTPPADPTTVAKFYNGNVRSGVVLNEDYSLVIIGDVGTGAEVISKGNIIVLGALRGNAFAGSDGNNNCFVCALTMNPAQIRIGDIVARTSDSVILTKNEEREPKIAIVKDDTIAIEIINKTVLNNINL